MKSSAAIGTLVLICGAAAPASAQEFEFVERIVRSPGTAATGVRVYADGRVNVLRKPGQRPLRIHATPTEVSMVRRGVHRARLRELPEEQLASTRFGFRLTLRDRYGLKRYTAQALGPIMRRRFRVLLAQLDRLEARARQEATPRAAPFTEFSRTLYTWPKPGEAYVHMRYTLSLTQSGDVVLDSRADSNQLAPIRAQLTAHELATVREAYARARIRSIPFHTKRTPGVDHYTFTVTDTLNGETPFAGDVGRYGRHQDRLGPLMTALDLIQTRLLQEQPPITETVTATVRVDGSKVYLNTQNYKTYRVTDKAFSKELAKLDQATVTLEGHVKPLDLYRTDFEPTGWIDPVRKDVRGNVRVFHSTPHVLVEGEYTQKTTHGNAADVLTKLDGRDVRLDAWVFKGPFMHVNAVYARAESDIGNVAKEGEQVLVTRLSKSGTSLLVKHPLNGSGRARLSQIGFECGSAIGLVGRLSGVR